MPERPFHVSFVGAPVLLALDFSEYPFVPRTEKTQIRCEKPHARGVVFNDMRPGDLAELEEQRDDEAGSVLSGGTVDYRRASDRPYQKRKNTPYFFPACFETLYVELTQVGERAGRKRIGIDRRYIEILEDRYVDNRYAVVVLVHIGRGCNLFRVTKIDDANHTTIVERFPVPFGEICKRIGAVYHTPANALSMSCRVPADIPDIICAVELYIVYFEHRFDRTPVNPYHQGGIVTMEKTAIEAKNVTKRYGSLTAVDALSFKVEQSTCFGILGPNGAGKTTMMKMLYAKTLRDDPETSDIRVFGYDPVDSELEIKYLSGIVPQEDNLDLELDVTQNLIIYAKFYGIKTKEAMVRINELLEFMELYEKRHEKIRHLSGGMKRRLVIARGLINSPHLLILDEPTTGLDPQVRHVIWDKLRDLQGRGVTILITTHYMDEAFQLCDKLIIMHNGRKILEGNPTELIEENIETYVLEIIQRPDSIDQTIFGTVRMDRTERRTLLYSNDTKELERIGRRLETGKHFIRQANLEDLFLQETGRDLNE